MRVPLDWLAEFVEIPDDVDALAARLTSAGFEVERIDRLAVPDQVVAAKIVSVEPIEGQPGATLCRVEAGSGRALEVVCGAPDAVAGRLFALALPGAVLPEATVRPREMRGRMSEAVLCSERDLGLSDDHGGLLAIDPADFGRPAGGSAVAPGDALAGLLPETVVLDLAISPNRGDCASILGVAREVAAESAAAVGAAPRDPSRLLLVSRREHAAYNSVGQTLPALRKRLAYNPAHLNPADAARLGIVDGAVVEIESGAGRIRAVAHLAPDVREGVVSLAHGFEASSTAALVDDEHGYEPLSGLPLMSAVPVVVRPAAAEPARGLA